MMKDRFTHSSRLGRGKIPREMKDEIFLRDDFTCQFCDLVLPREELTIDHLVPLADGGLDEPTNYVTSCRACNQRKADIPLPEFARSLRIRITSLPIHGDPIIDNEKLPIALRILRKRIYDRIRHGKLNASNKRAQKKIEQTFRRDFWQTSLGKQLEAEFPNLPGPVRIMIPEIQTIAKTTNEYLLLIELAKSANTRNLIGSVLTEESNVEERLISLRDKSKDAALTKRIDRALERYQRELRNRNP
jgi:hypothetical protein